MTTLDILVKYREGLLNGLLVTVQMSLLIWSIGLLGGTALAILGNQFRTSLGPVLRTVSFVLSGIPVLVLLFWLHFPAQEMADVVIQPFYTTVLAISLVNIMTVHDLMSTSLRNFPRQHLLAAAVCGIPRKQAFLHIQLPLMLREVTPGILFSQVVMLQATLFGSLISANELFRVAQQINALEYRPVQIYTALGLFFLAVCLPMNGVALYLKHRYSRDISEI